MPRSVNHVASRAKRKKILKLTRGYFGARKNVWTVAKNTWEKGLTYAYRDRKNKKRNFRALWIQRINAAARLEDLSYSKLMGMLHKAGIEINRKVLADLAGLFGGSPLMESIFNYPGIGQAFSLYIAQRDYFMIVGILLFESFILVLANLVADSMYSLIDPRIRRSV